MTGAATTVPVPAPSASAPTPPAPGARSVKLADTEVFKVRVPLGNTSAEERAQRSTKALAPFANASQLPKVTLTPAAEDFVVSVDQTPIARLTQSDAEAAGFESAEVYAGLVAHNIEEALEAEQRRSRIANQVFSLSLVVFFGLIAFYLAQRVALFTHQLRNWVEVNGAKLTVRIRDVEVVRSEMVQSASLVFLGVVRWLGQGAVLYLWLVASLSLFGLTRYTEKLTGFVLSPLSELTTRVATTLPLLVVALIAGLAVLLLVRFVELLFAGVARSETTLAWVPADLAIPTSILLRIGIVIGALVLVAPVVTGDAEGILPRLGFVMLGALALGSVPLLASGLVGVVMIFGRRLRLHDRVAISGVEGEVVGLDLLEVRLATARGETRMPMLVLCFTPLKKLGAQTRVLARVDVRSDSDLDATETTLRRAASTLLQNVEVELETASGDALCYRVDGDCRAPEDRKRLVATLVEALRHAGIALASRSGESAR